MYCSFKTHHLYDAAKEPAFSEKHIISKCEIKTKQNKNDNNKNNK